MFLCQGGKETRHLGLRASLQGNKERNMIRIQEGETKQEGENHQKGEEAAEAQATLECAGIAIKFLITTWQLAPSKKLTKEKAADLLPHT